MPKLLRVVKVWAFAAPMRKWPASTTSPKQAMVIWPMVMWIFEFMTGMQTFRPGASRKAASSFVFMAYFDFQSWFINHVCRFFSWRAWQAWRRLWSFGQAVVKPRMVRKVIRSSWELRHARVARRLVRGQRRARTCALQ